MNSIEQFFQEVSQDPTLQQQIQSISDGEARVNKVVNLGQEKGYNFTQSEVEQWLQNKHQELSESELESVAGGKHSSNEEQFTQISTDPNTNPDAFYQEMLGWKFGSLR